MVIGGLPPIGCLLIQITARFKIPSDRKCLGDQNLDSQAYNQKLAKMLPELQESLPGSIIVYADVYEPLIDLIKNPQKYGKGLKAHTHSFLNMYYIYMCVI